MILFYCAFYGTVAKRHGWSLQITSVLPCTQAVARSFLR